MKKIIEIRRDPITFFRLFFQICSLLADLLCFTKTFFFLNVFVHFWNLILFNENTIAISFLKVDFPRNPFNKCQYH